MQVCGTRSKQEQASGTWRDGRRVGRTVGATLGGALGATVGREGAAVHDGDLEMEGSDVGRYVYDGLCKHAQHQGQHHRQQGAECEGEGQTRLLMRGDDKGHQRTGGGCMQGASQGIYACMHVGGKE